MRKLHVLLLCALLFTFSGCNKEDAPNTNDPEVVNDDGSSDDPTDDTSGDSGGDTDTDGDGDTTDDTPPDYSSILLKRTIYVPFPDDFTEIYSYNSARRIVNRSVWLGYNSFGYDTEGRLISESGVDDIYGRATDYTYEADALVVVEKTWTFPEGGTVIYKFESLNTDSPTMTLIGTNDIGETIEELFELTIEKDADDRITYYKQVSTETSETEEIIATYTGNNLTRLEFIPGDVYEMVYDDKKAPFYGRASFFAYGSVRMFGVPTEIFDGLWGKPFFSEFLNENNLIELRVNGSLELEYIYTYNEFDYPDTMINPQSSTGGDLRFRYEYLYIE